MDWPRPACTNDDAEHGDRSHPVDEAGSVGDAAGEQPTSGTGAGVAATELKEPGRFAAKTTLWAQSPRTQRGPLRDPLGRRRRADQAAGREVGNHARAGRPAAGSAPACAQGPASSSVTPISRSSPVSWGTRAISSRQ